MAVNNQQSMDTGSISSRVDVDSPPFSRIFIVCSKKHSSEDMRAAFEQFGTIEDIWVVKDKQTKENRGVCYIKFAKASSAARACEEMDGKIIADDPKPIKVRFDFDRLRFQTNHPLSPYVEVCIEVCSIVSILTSHH